MSKRLEDKAMKKSIRVKTLNRKESKVSIYGRNLAPFAKKHCALCVKTITTIR
jgi:hypothetical protein